MSGALWFYFWDSSTAAFSASADSAGSGKGKGKGRFKSDEYIDWEALSQAREDYLKSKFTQAEHHVVAMEPDWPDPILKPRRKRTY